MKFVRYKWRLDAELKLALKHEAQRRGTSIAALMDEFVEHGLAEAAKQRRASRKKRATKTS